MHMVGPYLRRVGAPAVSSAACLGLRVRPESPVLRRFLTRIPGGRTHRAGMDRAGFKQKQKYAEKRARSDLKMEGEGERGADFSLLLSPVPTRISQYSGGGEKKLQPQCDSLTPATGKLKGEGDGRVTQSVQTAWAEHTSSTVTLVPVHLQWLSSFCHMSITCRVSLPHSPTMEPNTL
ncbi:hypothetical protein DPEC_G00344740 [Dallia pectoralis]|uniref:Uncharacterized protein n=1 Tax=Dallia pectoralis TaxID=75939 RepID=A0ACC2F3D0_DALPE|nr:hypothetical protein DPEC_G00344740 [Dallia pectoralis]